MRRGWRRRGLCPGPGPGARGPVGLPQAGGRAAASRGGQETPSGPASSGGGGTDVLMPPGAGTPGIEPRSRGLLRARSGDLRAFRGAAPPGHRDRSLCHSVLCPPCVHAAPGRAPEPWTLGAGRGRPSGRPGRGRRGDPPRGDGGAGGRRRGLTYELGRVDQLPLDLLFAVDDVVVLHGQRLEEQQALVGRCGGEGGGGAPSGPHGPPGRSGLARRQPAAPPVATCSQLPAAPRAQTRGPVGSPPPACREGPVQEGPPTPPSGAGARPRGAATVGPSSPLELGVRRSQSGSAAGSERRGLGGHPRLRACGCRRPGPPDSRATYLPGPGTFHMIASIFWH